MWPFKKKVQEKVNVGKAEITITLTNGDSHTWVAFGKLLIGDEYVIDGVEAAHESVKHRLQAKGLMMVKENTYVPTHHVKDVKVGVRQDHFV